MSDFLTNLKKRPILPIFIALVTAAGCFGIQFNGFVKKFGSFSVLLKTQYSQLLTDMAEWLRSRATDPKLLATTIAIAVLTLLAASVVSAFFISGFSYVMYVNTYNGIHRIAKKRKTGSLFKEGTNKRFWNVTAYIFMSVLILAGMVFLLAYITMPVSISVEKVLAGDTAQILPMLFLVAVLIVVLFFSIVFYTMYVSYLLPSIVAFKKGAVRVAFKIVNSYCWYLIPRTLLFLIYNLGVEIAMLALGYGHKSISLAVVVFLINWILRTAGILFYSHYVFKTYIEMKEDMFDEC